jgi:AmiR/NasT family two-component response regulator
VRNTRAHDGDDDVAAALEAAHEQIVTLREALQRRTVIGEAIGITMIRDGLTEDAAVARLVELSQGTNVKVREIAQQVVADASDQAAGRRVVVGCRPPSAAP